MKTRATNVIIRLDQLDALNSIEYCMSWKFLDWYPFLKFVCTFLSFLNYTLDERNLSCQERMVYFVIESISLADDTVSSYFYYVSIDCMRSSCLEYYFSYFSPLFVRFLTYLWLSSRTAQLNFFMFSRNLHSYVCAFILINRKENSKW